MRAQARWSWKRILSPRVSPAMSSAVGSIVAGLAAGSGRWVASAAESPSSARRSNRSPTFGASTKRSPSSVSRIRPSKMSSSRSARTRLHRADPLAVRREDGRPLLQAGIGDRVPSVVVSMRGAYPPAARAGRAGFSRSRCARSATRRSAAAPPSIRRASCRPAPTSVPCITCSVSGESERVWSSQRALSLIALIDATAVQASGSTKFRTIAGAEAQEHRAEADADQRRRDHVDRDLPQQQERECPGVVDPGARERGRRDRHDEGEREHDQ